MDTFFILRILHISSSSKLSDSWLTQATGTPFEYKTLAK